MKGGIGVLARQPVRTYLYGVLIPAVAVAGGYGLVSDDKAALWIALGGAVLLPFGIEGAQRKVTPVVYPHDDEGRLLHPLLAYDDAGVEREVTLEEAAKLPPGPCPDINCTLPVHGEDQLHLSDAGVVYPSNEVPCPEAECIYYAHPKDPDTHKNIQGEPFRSGAYD